MIALVGMAFFAVIREGFETSVFLLAAFDSSTNPARGRRRRAARRRGRVGDRLRHLPRRHPAEPARFFRVTGLVLVLVAAGLVATALHTAHEAGWLNSLQGQALDLRWLVAPGTVRSSLLTGMLGFQPRPVIAEAIGYLVYAIPMAIYVLWPSGLRLRRQRRPRTARRRPHGMTVRTRASWPRPASRRRSRWPAAAAASGQKTGPRARVRRRQADRRRLRPGRADARRRARSTFEVANDGADAVSEFEILDGDRILGEVENLAPGLSGQFSLTLEPGRYTMYCPGGTSAERGPLVVTGRGRRDERRRRPRRSRRYRRYVEQPDGAARRPDDAPVRRRRCRPATSRARRPLYAAARVPYERIEPVAESFGEPRPGDRRARRRRPDGAVDGLPPDRADALGARRRPPAPARWPTKLLDDVTTLQRRVADDRARAGADRERRRRAARRGLEVEDHRRGGALLAHRPRRLRGQRRRRARPRSVAFATWSWPRRPGAREARSTERFADVDAALEPYRRGRRLRLLHGADERPTPRALEPVDRRARRAALRRWRRSSSRHDERRAAASPGAGCWRPARSAPGVALGGVGVERLAAGGGGDAAETVPVLRRAPGRDRDAGAGPAPLRRVRPRHRARRRELRDLLRAWTEAAARMSAGRAGRARREPRWRRRSTPARRSASSPARLTVTFGFGPSLFDGRPFGLERRGRRRSPSCRPSPATSSTRSAPAATSASRPAPTTRRSPSTPSATSPGSAAARSSCAGRSSASAARRRPAARRRRRAT